MSESFYQLKLNKVHGPKPAVNYCNEFEQVLQNKNGIRCSGVFLSIIFGQYSATFDISPVLLHLVFLFQVYI